MRNLKSVFAVAVLGVFSISATTANAGMRITEFNSNSGALGEFEFAEFTNIGLTPVDMNGWSEDDGNRTAHHPGHDLSAFGFVQPGESVIFTQAQPNDFRVYWWGSVAASPATLKIIGPYTTHGLGGSGDEINLYDNSFAPGITNLFTDRLTYYPENGGVGAGGVTRNGPLAALGLNDNTLWANSFVGDTFGSFAAVAPSTGYSSPTLPLSPSTVGNPGIYTPVPEPSTGVLALFGVGALGAAAMCRARNAWRNDRALK